MGPSPRALLAAYMAAVSFGCSQPQTDTLKVEYGERPRDWFASCVCCGARVLWLAGPAALDHRARCRRV